MVSFRFMIANSLTIVKESYYKVYTYFQNQHGKFKAFLIFWVRTNILRECNAFTNKRLVGNHSSMSVIF